MNPIGSNAILKFLKLTSFILLVAIQSACSNSSPYNDNQDKMTIDSTTNKSVNLNSLSISIHIDESIVYQPVEDFFLFEDKNRKLTRHPRTFQIGPATEETGAFQYLLESESVSIKYNLRNDHQGSSGEEQFLMGLLSLKQNGKSYALKAWDNASSPDATWGLKYLKTVQEL